MMGIGAVKGVEIGDGFAVAGRFGSENNDPMTATGFSSNHAGGILGGISSGQEIVVRIAVKPTPSIAKPQQTSDIHGNAVEITVRRPARSLHRPPDPPGGRSHARAGACRCGLEQEKYR